MIRLEELDNYIQSLVSRIAGLNKAVLTIEEDHFASQLRDINQNQYPLLLVAFPSANSTGQTVDSIKWNNVTLFYILHKPSKSNRTYTQEIAEMQTLQDLTIQIKNQILEDITTPPWSCSFIKDTDTNSLTIDPERNLLSHEGWSLGFKFNTI